MATLIAALAARAHNPEVATDLGAGVRSLGRDGQPVPSPFVARPVATEAAIAAAEATLGFPLPALLKRLYLEVGNGDFGQGCGLLGVPSGAPGETQETALSLYQEQRDAADEPRAAEEAAIPPMAWPERLLPICDWGCAIYSAIDCGKPEAPVRRYDPNALDEHAETPEATDAMVLLPERESLGAWLQAWLDGEDLWEALDDLYEQRSPHAIALLLGGMAAREMDGVGDHDDE